ncbi:MAG: DUF3575 domain-containing protein [Saprospiraceae bacterium]|nr:DUF3575 domain-containing protein [Saprospiraceae bacterium]
MKTKPHAYLLAWVFLTTFNAYSQQFMLKGGLCVPTQRLPVELYTLGFDAKVKEQMSVGISYKTLSKYGNNTLKQSVLTLQGRYYLNHYDWTAAHYIGVLLQKFDKEYNWESFTELFKHRTIGEMHKYGIGVMAGQTHIIYKRLGLDLNVGGVVQIGQKTKDLIYTLSSSNQYYSSNRDVNIRFFIGANIYLAVGKK